MSAEPSATVPNAAVIFVLGQIVEELAGYVGQCAFDLVSDDMGRADDAGECDAFELDRMGQEIMSLLAMYLVCRPAHQMTARHVKSWFEGMKKG